MRKKYWVTIVILITISMALFLWLRNSSEQAIMFFPLDDTNRFTETGTHLDASVHTDGSAYTLNWKSKSVSENTLYLRQDAALLFKSGKLIGVKSKWKSDTDTIAFNGTHESAEDNIYETIAFHYGEIHGERDKITSIQEMTDDSVFIKKQDDDFLVFHSPENDKHKKAKKELENKKDKKLMKHYQRLMHHYSIDSSAYDALPLTELIQFQEKPIDGMSQKETNQIMGQLWEGLYKNYILPATRMDDPSSENYIPLVLFPRESGQIIVLFSLDGEMEKLIQQYPPSFY